MKGIYVAVLTAVFLAALIAVLVRYLLRGRRLAEKTWEDLLKQITWVDRDTIATIALDVVDEAGHPKSPDESFTLDPARIWTLLGGLKGLELIAHNCRVLVELASYVQTWYPEALIVAEQLRLNAREIEWHVNRLKGAAQTGNLQSSFAAYAQRAVVTYYVMTRHVLELYGQVGFPRLTELQQLL